MRIKHSSVHLFGHAVARHQTPNDDSGNSSTRPLPIYQSPNAKQKKLQQFFFYFCDGEVLHSLSLGFWCKWRVSFCLSRFFTFIFLFLFFVAREVNPAFFQNEFLSRAYIADWQLSEIQLNLFIPLQREYSADAERVYYYMEINILFFYCQKNVYIYFFIKIA